MATAPIYCTHKELKRVYPQVSEFDTKVPIYGWAEGLQDTFQSSLDVYFTHNTGLVSQMYFDGAEVLGINYRGSNGTNQGVLNGVMTIGDTVFNLDAGHSVEVDDIVKIGEEYIKVTAVSTNEITTTLTNRGLFNTSAVEHPDDTSVYIIIDADEDVGNATSGGLDALAFVYDTHLDMCLLVTNSVNPADYLVEAGEDFTTMVTQFRTDASRYLDSRLDPNLPREQLKDKSGNFDYMIVRTTALLCAVFLIRSKDPTNEDADSMMADAQGNIDALNNGQAGLSWQNTSDSSKGVVRDVTYTGTVRPVDTRGSYSGTYDLIKIKIIDGGAIGTATYSVWAKNGDKLGMNEGTQVVTAETINGDYQALAGGLQIRFSGTDFSSTATANDIWEVEVAGWAEEVDSSSLKPIRMTRRWQ